MGWKGIERARELRKNQTPSEKMLWEVLRNRKFHNLKFRRQWPILFGTSRDFFIADFYCSEKKVIIELDGKIHLKNRKYDEFRDEIIESFRIKVIRIKNEELSNIELVKNRLELELNL